LRETLAHQEIAVADDQADGHACPGDAAHLLGNVRGERLAQLIVSDPDVEHIAEEVDGRCGARGTRAERIEDGDERRARRRQVKVGDEQRGLYATSSAL